VSPYFWLEKGPKTYVVRIEASEAMTGKVRLQFMNALDEAKGGGRIANLGDFRLKKVG